MEFWRQFPSARIDLSRQETDWSRFRINMKNTFHIRKEQGNHLPFHPPARVCARRILPIPVPIARQAAGRDINSSGVPFPRPGGSRRKVE